MCKLLLVLGVQIRLLAVARNAAPALADRAFHHATVCMHVKSVTKPHTITISGFLQ